MGRYHVGGPNSMSRRHSYTASASAIDLFFVSVENASFSAHTSIISHLASHCYVSLGIIPREK